jgi:hypothetical protein
MLPVSVECFILHYLKKLKFMQFEFVFVITLAVIIKFSTSFSSSGRDIEVNSGK